MNIYKVVIRLPSGEAHMHLITATSQVQAQEVVNAAYEFTGHIESTDYMGEA